MLLLSCLLRIVIFNYTFSYRQAQVAAKEALEKLRKLGVPTERPEDYFAEMVKSDAHMQKVIRDCFI